MPYSDRPGGISIHAVDIASGRAAAGMRVVLMRIDGEARILVAEGTIGQDGFLDHPAREGAGVLPGLHEAVLEIGGYYRGRGTDTFLAAAPFRFVMSGAAEHLHLPVKFTPFGLMVFRGV